MTVIACDLKTQSMAADRLCHEDDGSQYMASKMIQLEDGSVIGGAGNHPEIVMEWIRRGCPENDRPVYDVERDDFSILHLTANKLLLYVNSLVPHQLTETNYAIGTGADVALYCMRVLKYPPEQAAKEATKISFFCGGEIDLLKLQKRI